MAKINETEPVRFAILAADTVVFTLKDYELYVRLTKIERPPFFINAKGLPGGLVDPKETAEQAAKRHIEAKAGISAGELYTEQLYTFSTIDRDPRGRVVAVAHLALVPWEKLSLIEQKDTYEAWWIPVKKKQILAYDHNEILAMALGRLRSRVVYTTLLSRLMPKEFTLTELESAYAGILNTKLDKRNFRKKILKLGILTPVEEKQARGKFRPAQLYRFASSKVEEIEIL